MSIPPLPAQLANTRVNRAANALHSIAIHVLRRARVADRESGLSPERLSLLSVLCFAGPKTVGQLAEVEMVSRPAISRIIKALEASGLARRSRDRADGRQVWVNATRQGVRLVEAGRERRLRRIAAELARLDADELATVDAALRLLD